MADGSLNFDTKINTEGFEGGVDDLKALMKQLASSIDELSKSIKNAFTGVNTTEIKKAVESTSESLTEADDSARRMQESMKNIDAAIARMDSESVEIVPESEISSAETLSAELDDIAATVQEINSIPVDDIIPESTQSEIETSDHAATGFKNTIDLIVMTARDIPIIFKRAGDGIKNAFFGAGNAVKSAVSSLKAGAESENQVVKSMVDEIDRYKDHIQSLEAQGYYFGDKEYDEAYGRLYQLNQELNAYKKSLTQADAGQKKVSNSAKKTSKSVDHMSRSTRNGRMSMLKMLKMSLLFSVVFRSLNAATTAVKEGFQNLAQFSGSTNKSLSTLATAGLTLKNSFATAFDPILTAITPALQTLINYLSQAITTAGQFFAVFLNGATTFTKAKDAQVDYASSIKKTAKEADKSLSSIDKLNTVGDSSGSTGTPGIPDPSQMFEEVKIDSKVVKFVDNLKKQLDPIIKAFERLKVAAAPFTSNVGKGLKWLLDNVIIPLGKWTVSSLIPAFFDTLGASIGVLNALVEVFKPYGLWLWDNFLKPIASWTGGMIIQGLKLLTDGLNSLSEWIMNNQGTVAAGVLLIGSFFAAFKIAEFLIWAAPFIASLVGMITSGTALSAVLSGISAALAVITSPITIITAALGLLIYSFINLYKNSEEFRKSIADLGSTWLTALQPLADFVGTVLSDAWNKILKPIIEFFLNTLLPNLISTFKNLWEKILVPLANFIGTVLQPVFKILSDLLMILWQKVILPLAQAIGTVLKDAWNGIYQVLNKTIIPIIKVVIDVLTWLWKNVINPIIKVLWENLKPAFETVFDGIKTVINGLRDVMTGIIKFITGVFTSDWKRAWEGVKQIFKGIFDALVGIVKTPINLIIDIINGMIGGITTGINTVIKAVNGISFDMPDWLGGGHVGFNLPVLTAPKIPKLATGTVVPKNYGEFLAVLGDNKREAEVVSPLSTMKQAFKEVMSEMGGAATGEVTVNVYLSGKQIHTEVVKQDKDYRNQNGGESAFA